MTLDVSTFLNLDAEPGPRRFGIREDATGGRRVKGVKHFVECLMVSYPEEGRCTCWDDSPEWSS